MNIFIVMLVVIIATLLIWAIGFSIWGTVIYAGSKAADKAIFCDKDLKEILIEERQKLNKKSDNAFGAFVIIGVIIGAIVMLLISESLGMPLV